MDQLCKEPHFDLTIDENEIINGAKEIIKKLRPTWPLDKLRFKTFTDGITNKLVGVWYPGHYNEMVLVRVYGNKTDLLINRKDETRNIRILNRAGFTHSLYATFNNGLAYEFIQGTTLTTESVRNPDVYTLIAKKMAQMHKLKPSHIDIPKEAFIWDKVEQFMEIMPKEFSNETKQTRFEKLIKPFTVLKQNYQNLKRTLTDLNSDIVFAHNDLLLGNVLYNQKENIVTFIDFEYTAYNYQAFDIANHFAEFAGNLDIFLSTQSLSVFEVLTILIMLCILKKNCRKRG
ncbi:ethanolamine kinase 1 isoform X2 [Calliopsis andreniformis]|uniref:ethanolamine kinase 1 isoform X2 n=1 Tax=Calliopsis andreniformis TaxID=337506 RepID=UPI003FCCBC2D